MMVRMKVVSIGTDRKIFEKNSAVRQRMIEYGKFFEEIHIIIFSKKNFEGSIDKLSDKYQISDNVFIYPTNSISKSLYIWDAFVIAKKLIKNSRKFIVSTQDPFETGLVGVFIKLFFDLPLHVQAHTDLMHKYFRQSSPLNRTRFLMAEFILRYADRVRVVSERIKKSISIFSKNIDVLPIKTEIKEDFGENIKKPFPFTLLMVCRMEKEKNIEIVLQTIKNLNNESIGLCIVGDGSQKADLEKMAKDMDISEKVIFAGWQNNLVPYYKMADAFISASLYEGYGISTMEAAYFGKPLILSETGMAREIFKEGESAFVCDAKDRHCFSQSILKIYKDKNLAEKMGQSAKAAAKEVLNSEQEYFKKYADSILKTAGNFKKNNLFVRIFELKKNLFHSFIALRYFICGLTAATVNIGSLYIFTDIFGVWYLYSSILAFILSLVISFSLQKFVVFKDRGIRKIHHQFSKFFVAAVLGVMTNTFVVFICVDAFGIWYIFSQIIAGFFVMIQNFILYHIFIFNKK
jgi:glycosyltransferase involved in cell wall biosynthesis/putative flippase GtrA